MSISFDTKSTLVRVNLVDKDTSIQVVSQASRIAHIAGIVQVWVKSKSRDGKSERTKKIYEESINSFRSTLHLAEIDLDGLPISHTPTLKERKQALVVLSLAAQGWASRTERVDTVSDATVNQRLSILSSFYSFARKRRLLIMDNPIDLLDRREIQEYANAQPLAPEKVEHALKSINRTVVAGKRDYALLLILYSTGRRASEVLSLQWQHVEQVENTAILHFEHCKGDKEMFDKLEPRVWYALKDYLRTAIMHDLACLEAEQYLWISFSMKNFKQPLTQRGLADVFNKHLHTMHVHSMRHTFAHEMEKSGASVTDIQERLGHSNPATTGRYLQRLRIAENKYATAMLDSLGIESAVE